MCKKFQYRCWTFWGVLGNGTLNVNANYLKLGCWEVSFSTVASYKRHFCLLISTLFHTPFFMELWELVMWSFHLTQNQRTAAQWLWCSNKSLEHYWTISCWDGSHINCEMYATCTIYRTNSWFCVKILYNKAQIQTLCWLQHPLESRADEENWCSVLKEQLCTVSSHTPRGWLVFFQAIL